MSETSENLLINIINLVIPDKREESLARLKFYIGKEAISKLQDLLSQKQFTYRHNGLITTRVLEIISEFMDNHEYSPTSPTRALSYVYKYQELSPNSFNFSFLHGKTVLDYGCGIHNPLAISILFYLNGANRCIASDPGVIDISLSVTSIKALIIKFLKEPLKFNFSGISLQEMMFRFSSLNWSELLSGNFTCLCDGPISFYNTTIESFANNYQQSIDICVSTTVLEHIEDMQKESDIMFDTSSQGSFHIHRIDMTDHRHFLPNYHPLAFMQTGLHDGINGLRYSDFEKIFLNSGFKILKKDTIRYSLTPEFLKKIETRWKYYSLEELETTYAGIVLMK